MNEERIDIRDLVLDMPQQGHRYPFRLCPVESPRLAWIGGADAGAEVMRELRGPLRDITVAPRPDVWGVLELAVRWRGEMLAIPSLAEIASWHLRVLPPSRARAELAQLCGVQVLHFCTNDSETMLGSPELAEITRRRFCEPPPPSPEFRRF